MTEGEWLFCSNPHPMLLFRRNKTSQRKLRLFACACCRRIWRLMHTDAGCRNAVIVNERFADGLATQKELEAARSQARSCEYSATQPDAFFGAVEAAKEAAYCVGLLALNSDVDKPIFSFNPLRTPAVERLELEESSQQAALLREILGNPLHTPTVNPSWLVWNDGTTPKLAQGIYDERAFDRMPILGDALEEAGCDQTDILQHCRQPEHVRGCWVIDLLLGKE